MFGSTEIIVIAVVICVLFGAAAITKFTRSIGQANLNLKKALKTEDDSNNKDKENKDK